jgi:diguanylate cyclase (GGDEF)-like protein
MNRYYRARKIISENWKNDLIFLEQFSDQISACHDEPSIFSCAAKATEYIAPFCRSAILLFSDGRAAVQTDSGWQRETLSQALDVLSDTGLPEEEMSFTLETPSKITVLCLSFQCETGSQACMLIGTDDPETLNEHRRKMLLNIAELSGNALSARRRLHDERSRARTDELTRVYNKRYFIEEWPGWLERALEEKTPLAVAIFDIDNFKGYNDTFGHLNGDRLLIRVAQAISMQIRDGDVVARFGGEEFVVMFGKSDLQTGYHIAERIRHAVQELNGDEVLRTVTISGGIAALPDDPEDPAALLECADRRLYHAKKNGRNQNCMAG